MNFDDIQCVLLEAALIRAYHDIGPYLNKIETQPCTAGYDTVGTTLTNALVLQTIVNKFVSKLTMIKDTMRKGNNNE